MTKDKCVGAEGGGDGEMKQCAYFFFSFVFVPVDWLLSRISNKLMALFRGEGSLISFLDCDWRKLFFLPL